jgi:hypothetical protein
MFLAQVSKAGWNCNPRFIFQLQSLRQLHRARAFDDFVHHGKTFCASGVCIQGAAADT